VLHRTRDLTAAARALADHRVPDVVEGVRNTGERALLVPPQHAAGAYIGFVGS